uniref:ATP synthase F0 subunit 8 n=1 Tax=Pyxicephalus adspersus TaxID=30357 RepID=A0AAV3A4E5_PYXAD|nr:TPA: hypothetical protein GDO54_017964 [Pyxicephalus adspersus]
MVFLQAQTCASNIPQVISQETTKYFLCCNAILWNYYVVIMIFYMITTAYKVASAKFPSRKKHLQPKGSLRIYKIEKNECLNPIKHF